MLTCAPSQNTISFRLRPLSYFLCVLAVSGIGFEAGALSPEAAVSANAAKIRAQCEIKRIAKACYETGLTEMHYNDAQHRKSARHFLKLACSIEKHALCNRTESKVATKAYLATPGRQPATAVAKAPIVAPKIAVSKTSFSSSAPAPAPPSYDASHAPLEPLNPPPPAPPMPPQGVEMAPPPPMPMDPNLQPQPMMNGCQPGDLTCGARPQ